MSKSPSLCRRVLGATYGVGVLAVVGTLVVFATHSLQQSDAFSSILSGLTALVTLYAAAVSRLRRGRPLPKPDEAADALVRALLAEWEPEMRNRRRRFTDDPRTIPLMWMDASETFGTGPKSVIGADKVGEIRLKLDGRLDENPDAAARELANRFTRLPGKQRLVVLGEPGAGKTFLAITLTIGLLRQWTRGTPIAMFLSLASWDPIVESLDDWLVRRIAAQYYGGQRQTAKMLLDERLLIPVLDGLDELPEHVRRLAVTRINHTLDGDRPVVLTCRTIEYKDNLVGGAPVLLRAPVVHVQPVAMADIQSYLREIPAWHELARHVREQPEGPIAQTLSTPLMLSLFAVAYKDRDPNDLLRNKSLSTRHEVEDHLVDTLLETAYPKEGRWYFDWTSNKAKRWLTYLAHHMHEHNTRELSPWRMAREVLTPVLIPTIVFVPILAYLVLGPDDTVVAWSMMGTAFGAAFIARNRRIPGKDAVRDKRRAETLTAGVVAGSLSVVAALPLFLFGFVNTTYVENYAILAFYATTGALVALAIAVGLGFGLNEILVARLFAKRDAKNNGRDFLVQDRVSSLVAGLVTAVFVGLVGIPFATLLAAVGGFAGQRIQVLVGMPALVDQRLPPLDLYVDWDTSLTGLIETSAWFAVVFAFAVLSTRTWMWLLVLRVWLGVTRRMPWRLVAFLESGHQRGILRGSGGSYQFGHALLQERIIAGAVATRAKTRRRKVRKVVAAVAVVALLAGVVSVWSANPAGCRPTGMSILDHRMVRLVDGADSGCFAYLTDRDWDWDQLRRGSGSPSKLNEIHTMQPSFEDSGWQSGVFVTGEFDRFDDSRWPGVLDGIAAAQLVLRKQVRVVFVYADLGSIRDPDAAYLTAEYVDSIRSNDEIGNISGYASLNIDIPDSTVGVGPVDVVGLQTNELDTLLTDVAEEAARSWLDSSPPGLVADSLMDGVSDSECVMLQSEQASGAFDLRGVENAPEILAEVAQCGAVSVLIDSVTAGKLDADYLKLFTLSIYREESLQDAILPACQGYLGPHPREEALTSCEAMSITGGLAGSLLVDVRGELGA